MDRFYMKSAAANILPPRIYDTKLHTASLPIPSKKHNAKISLPNAHSPKRPLVKRLPLKSNSSVVWDLAERFPTYARCATEPVQAVSAATDFLRKKFPYSAFQRPSGQVTHYWVAAKI